MKKTLSLFISLSQKLLLTILPSFCLTILLSFSLAILLSSPARAQDNLGEKPPWRDSSFGQEYDDADLGSVNAGAYVDRTTKANMASISCMLLTIEGLCTEDPDKLIPMLRRSAVGMVSSNIAAMYMTPPADTRLFLADLGQTLGFVPKTAYAQGIGITGLSALLPLWKAFRNIAYLLMAIVMIVIGFMVMFRKKIDPKTVVTVQNAIPKIVVTLLLITFSYAIVGLMVDLMYLSILLVVGLFQSIPGLLPDPSWVGNALGYKTSQSLYTQGGIITNIWNIFGFAGAGGVTNTKTLTYQILGINPTLGEALSIVGVLGGLIITAATAPSGIGAAFGLGLAGASALPPIIALIVSLAIFFLILKLFIFFLSSYVQIILALIFSPLQLLTEAFPGSSAFSNWFKNLFSNLIVFPIGALMFMLSAIFANIANKGGDTHLWTPPFTPLLSASTVSISALLSLAILFVIPTIAGAVKEGLKAKPFVPAGPEGVVGALAQPASAGFQLYQFFHSREQVNVLRKIAGNKEAASSGGGGGNPGH